MAPTRVAPSSHQFPAVLAEFDFRSRISYAAKFHGFLVRADAARARRVNQVMEPAVPLRGMEL
jgi:hypothetical protein